MKLYADTAIWKQVNELIPALLRMTATELPEESFFPWRSSQIHVERFRNPESKVKLLMHHGVGTNGRLLSLIVGVQMARLGYEVIAVDMPLYGMTLNNEKTVTYDDWVDVSRKFIDAEYARDPRPIVLYGLSAGGMLAYHVAALEKRVRGIVGMCFLEPRDIDVLVSISKFPLPGIMERVGGFLVGLLGRSPLKNVRIPMKIVVKMSALCNHPQAQALLINDPVSGGNSVPLGFLASLFAYQPEVEARDFRRCPVLLTQPDDDRWTPLLSSARFFDELACPKQLVMLEGAGHYPMEEVGLKTMHKAIDDFLQGILQ